MKQQSSSQESRGSGPKVSSSSGGSRGTGSPGLSSNPIKEFRQRQRMRERQEDERLEQLESRFLSSRWVTLAPTVGSNGTSGTGAASLDQLYEAHGLNTKFPRVKTAMKRGKAADDSERSSRKKECARRDSKNYRERAKAKRDLVVRKIAFLENLFKSVSSAAAAAAAAAQQPQQQSVLVVGTSTTPATTTIQHPQPVIKPLQMQQQYAF